MLSNDPSRDPAILSHRIRRHAIEMTSRGRSSHVASVLSMADILGTL
jgi:transketolase N-terminal domain/subunit